MKLSVIIVNYNVRHFLEQCLHSVMNAAKNLDVEVFVVDNNSVDNSVEMVREKFPQVKIIANKENVGFSKANNQALRIAQGEYQLLLNPDTVVEEDTFKKIIQFMDEHPEAGGLGVYMIDGKGNFLPESKRGLPTPLVAFYKIFGLSALFPKSKLFGKYHLGYLDKNKIHEVEILSGAFMLLRKKALDKVGLLDEDFFMYGEDIDLSYRIIKGGFKNYYFPETRIIHYKGESTKKSSINYVFVFYNAMIIFAKKHFSQKHASIFSFLINLAIYLRAGIAILNRFLKQIFLPTLDALVIFGGLLFLKYYWENVVRADENFHFDEKIISIAFPIFVVVWLISIYLNGGYDKPVKTINVTRGVLSGAILILVAYALLPESLRFSRAMVLLGAAWSVFALPAYRYILHLLNNKLVELDTDLKKRIAVIGSREEYLRVLDFIRLSDVKTSFIGHIGLNEQSTKYEDSIGNFSQLIELIAIYQIDEVIFCAKDIPAQTIIEQMSRISNTDIEFKIAPPESLFIIGSNSINTNGQLYVININSINKAANKRNKRLLDIIVSFVLFIISPVLILIIPTRKGLLKNIFRVLIGKKSWVGYKKTNQKQELPKIKEGVLNPVDYLSSLPDETTIYRLNQLYAKDYKIINDLQIILKSWRLLGQ
ncbi:MAG: glycosyltransferase [Bacteroidia bacterium]